MDVECQCGSVRFKTPQSSPIKIYHCHCSLCRKQSGSAFGTSAVFPFFTIPLDSQPIGLYRRPNATTGATKECYFCKNCGVRLVHLNRNAQGELTGGANVKGGLIAGLDWSGAEHIYCDDMAIKTITFPEDTIMWAQEPEGQLYNRNKVKCIFDTNW